MPHGVTVDTMNTRACKPRRTMDFVASALADGLEHQQHLRLMLAKARQLKRRTFCTMRTSVRY